MKEYNQKNIPKNRNLVECLYYSVYHKSDRSAAKVSLQEIFSYTKLQILRLSGNLENDGDLEGIKALDQLRELSIAYIGHLPIPTCIDQLKNLTLLSFYEMEAKALCDEIGNLHGLKSFSMRHSKLKEIPDFVFRLTNLEELDLSDNDLTILPAKIGQLKHLKRLHLAHNKFEILPVEIAQLKHLEILNVNHNMFQVLPDLFDQLPQLKWLYIENNDLKICPSSLQKCLRLEKFAWLNNPFGDFPPELFYLSPDSIKHNHQAWNLRDRAQEIFKLVKAGQKATTDLHRQQLSIIANHNNTAVQNLSKSELLDLVAISQRGLHTLVLSAIFEKEATNLSENPIQAGSKLHIIGKTTLKKSEIASQLKNYDVQYASKYSKDVSHLILGDNAKKLDIETTAVVLSEQRLQDYLHEMDTPYLLEKDAGESLNVEHISTLLLSSDLDNARLGLELLEGGGVPKDLMTELFIIAKMTSDKPMQTKAKKMLKLNASEATLVEVKNRKQLTEHSWSIKKRFEETDLHIWKIAQYGYKNLQWRYALDASLETCPEKEALAFLDEIMEQEVGKSGYLSLDEDKTRFLDYLYQFNNIKVLYSYGNKKLTQIPDGISKMTALEEFKLSHSEIKKLPLDFGQLQLKKLSLEALAFDDWETEVQKINSLQRLESLNLTLLEGQFLVNLQASDTITNFELTIGDFGYQYKENLSTTVDQAAIDAILRFKNLTSLKIEGDLPFFPPTFSTELSHLKHFHFKTKRQLFELTLPETLNQWTALESLDINGIIAKGGIPNSLKGLQSLKTLHISFIKDEIPEALQELKQLTFLDIKGQMTFLPTWFATLEQLEKLEITDAQIVDPQAFADVINKMPALKTLRIQKTKTFGEKYKTNTFQEMVPNVKLEVRRY